MRLRSIAAVAWCSVACAALVTSLALSVTLGTWDPGDTGLLIPLSIGTVAMAVIGALIAARTGNAIGWIFLAIPSTLWLSQVAQDLADYGLPRGAAYGRFAYWLAQWPFFTSMLLLVAVFYLFPTGRIHSPRWRWPWRAYVTAAIVTILGFALLPYRNDDAAPGEVITNPIGVAPLEAVLSVVLVVSSLVLLGSGFLAFVSLVMRYRRAMAEERQQLRWLFAVGALALVALVLGIGSGIVAEQRGGGVQVLADALMIVLVTLLAAGIPLATGIAVFRHRLYDLDVVISRTVLYGALAGFVTLVYVAIVVGVGSLIGRGTDPSLALQVAATAVVAVVFQPVRDRAQRLANRLVYGRRATPYEVLSRFTERVAESYSLEDVLPRMARIVAEGTGAVRVRIWLNVVGMLRPEASWPPDAERAAAVATLEELPDHVVEVRHLGEPLGAITVAMPQNEAMNAVQETLLRDVAAQAGLLLRNVALVEDLRASRQRLVAAQDQERRRIERDIHDGAQQQLVALAVKLRLADALVGKDEPKAHEMLAQLHAETNDALQNLRDLARGIYPPLLAHDGLVAAIRAHARKGGLPVVVSSDGIGRYPQEVEAASYFCVLEALQNVAKYANATRIGVRLDATDDELRFEIQDDGVGFDPSKAHGAGLTNMRDRLEALGGSLQVGSSPGSGTTVSGRVPARVTKAVPS